MKNWTGERLETFIYGDTAVEHLHRYSMASTLIKDRVVLDIASGEGYGSLLLSKIARQVIGVDIDEQVVKNATLK
jgi:protein-L-isoaspartate O-methyltransferase